MTSTQNILRVFPFKVVYLHPGVTGRLLTLSFFFPSKSFFKFPNFKGDKLYTKIMQKNLGHSARSRAKEYRSSLPGPWIDNNTVFSECTGTHSPD